MWECAGKRFRITYVPRLEFSAYHPNKHVIPPRSPAEFDELSLDFSVISAVLISHYDEAHAWLTPSPEFSRYALRQISLALVRDTAKPHLREEAA